MKEYTDQDLIAAGFDVLQIEAESISRTANNLDESFALVCRAIINCRGRVIVTGIGKSGHIARKIAATLASTGTHAYFVHPSEAVHGDLGMIANTDLVLALSKSGETEELINLAPLLKRQGIFLISIIARSQSTLAKISDIHLNIHLEREACTLNLAPTASTTATLALGDAIAVAVLQAKNFKEEDFARSHPGGSLGRRLLVTIDNIMQQGDRLPKIISNTKLSDAIVEISSKCLGVGLIVSSTDNSKVIGICTDGDLRRAFSSGIELHSTMVDTVMTKNFKTINSRQLASEALHLMQEYKISALPVVDDENKLVGALNMHTLFAAGVV